MVAVQDPMEVLTAKDHYRVDPARVSLIGSSMGSPSRKSGAGMGYVPLWVVLPDADADRIIYGCRAAALEQGSCMWLALGLYRFRSPDLE